jgi:amidase
VRVCGPQGHAGPHQHGPRSRRVGHGRAARRPFLGEVGKPVTGLRVGYLDTNPEGSLDEECAAAVRQAAALLEQMGHRVGSAHPAALDESEASLQWVARWFVDATVVVDQVADIAGRLLGPDDMEPLTWVFSELGRQFSGADHARALAAAAAWGRRLCAWWDGGFDLLLTPTIAGPPPPLGELGAHGDDPFASMLDWGARYPFTAAFNISGQPAISVPFTTHADGMPLGLQFVAAPGREDLLLNVAAQLEDAVGWIGRRPGVLAD